MKLNNFLRITFCVLGSLTLASASCSSNVDRLDAQRQEQKLQEAQRQVGDAKIVNFTEKKLANLLLGLRDEQVATYSYVSTQKGLYFLCNSIGYGLPYATQTTNPQKIISESVSTGTIPQAEPNGLFMPSSAEASWAICGGESGLVPVYIEGKLVVSPFPLKEDGKWGLTPSIKTVKNKEVNLKLK